VLLGVKQMPSPEIPLSTVVRNALRTCVEGYEITEDQFEALYCGILEDEVYGRKNATGILNEFFAKHGIKRKGVE
jgi:hypothetical protein